MRYESNRFENLRVLLSEQILEITLDHPAVRNALTVPMMEGLRELFEVARVDPEVRCVVIAGAGESFSAGGNIKKMAEGQAAGDHPMNRPVWNVPTMTAAERMEKVEVTGLLVMEALWRIEKPTIAAINGHAVAAGLDLACACDLRVASDRARFACSYTKVGLVPFDGAMYWLPRLVGYGKAMEMMYLGDMIDAQEAYRIGLVNRVVPHEELAAEARALAARLAAGPSVAFQLTKYVTQRSLLLDFPAALNLGYESKNVVYATEDHRGAVQAFLAKQAPEFRGR